MTRKLPAMLLYTGDWLKDPALTICTAATRGIWFDCLCAMHELDRSGELRGTADQLSRVTRCQPLEFTQAMTELQTNQAADVQVRNGSYIVINRRMKRERAIQESSAERQRRFRDRGGGSPDRWTAIRMIILKRDDNRCAYCGRRGSTVDHIQPKSRGGTEDFKNLVACCPTCNTKKNNRTPTEAGMQFHTSFPVKNLEISNAEVTSLVADVLQQKNAIEDGFEDRDPEGKGGAGEKPTQAQLVIFNQERARVETRIKEIKDSYSDHQGWSLNDKNEIAGLRQRRDELKKLLGITI